MALPGGGPRACEYHTMPSIAVAMPRNFLSGISSPKNTQPPVRMITVLIWPTTLYVRLEVAPITCALPLASKPSIVSNQRLPLKTCFPTQFSPPDELTA